jgi:hypothetical protein
VQERAAAEAQREALKLAMQAVQLLKLQLFDLAERAETARLHAEQLTQKVEEAVASAEAAGKEAERLRDARQEPERKTVEVPSPEVPQPGPKRQPEPKWNAPEEAAKARVIRVGPSELAAPGGIRAGAPALARALELAAAETQSGSPSIESSTPEQFAAVQGNQLLTGPISWEDRRSSRRVHVKTRARIRHPRSSEVIQPVDVSRKGLCFESDTLYELNSRVWVALHYRHDDVDLMETPSRIVRVSVSGSGNAHSYGVKFEN